MLAKNRVFYLLLACCGVLSSDAETSRPGRATNYTVEVGYTNVDEDNDKGYFTTCNGALIDGKLVLTLASCVMNETYHMQSPYVVQIATDGDVMMLPFSQLEAIYAPSTFNATTSRDDIALVKLTAPLSATRPFQTLRVPREPAVAPDDRAKVITKTWLKYLLTEPNYVVAADVGVVDNDRCRDAYPGLADNGTLCAKFDGTSRPKQASALLPGSVAVAVDGRTLVGLLSRETDLSEEADDVQRYIDVHYHAGFVSNAVANNTRNMHYCINKMSYFRNDTNRPVWTCADSWE